MGDDLEHSVGESDGSQDPRKQQSELHTRIDELEAELRACREERDAMHAAHGAAVNLCVAYSRLQSSLNYAEVVQIIREIVINLVGCEQFAIYLRDVVNDKTFLLMQEGLDREQTAHCQKAAVVSVQSNTQSPVINLGSAENDLPTATIPLCLGKEAAGALVIYRLLQHRGNLDPHDLELLGLLGVHASVAMYCAKLAHIHASAAKIRLTEPIVDLTPPTPASLRERSRTVRYGAVDGRRDKMP